MRVATVSVVAIAVSGCASSPGTAEVAAAHGAADLTCRYENVSAYRSERGTWIARGCGGWAEYSCTRPYRSYLLWSEPAGSAVCSRIAAYGR